MVAATSVRLRIPRTRERPRDLADARTSRVFGGAGGGGTVTGEGEDNATRAADEGFGDAARGCVRR